MKLVTLYLVHIRGRIVPDAEWYVHGHTASKWQIRGMDHFIPEWEAEHLISWKVLASLPFLASGKNIDRISSISKAVHSTRFRAVGPSHYGFAPVEARVWEGTQSLEYYKGGLNPSPTILVA